MPAWLAARQDDALLSGGQHERKKGGVKNTGLVWRKGGVFRPPSWTSSAAAPSGCSGGRRPPRR
eukprot:scaffold2419_cov58-Phaeocystis_antarctica.AAC.1